MLRIVEEGTSFNRMLLQQFLSLDPELLQIKIVHSGLWVTNELPMIDSILSSVVSKRLLLNMTAHGGAVPIKMGVAYGVDGEKYRFFLTSHPLLLTLSEPNKVFTPFKVQDTYLELTFEGDVIEARPSDHKIEMQIDMIRGDFMKAAELMSMLGRQPKTTKIGGKRFKVDASRGPFKVGYSEIPVIFNPLTYVVWGFEDWVSNDLYIPDGFGYKKLSMVLSVETEKIGDGHQNPAYPLAAILDDGNYVLLRNLPKALFKDEDIVKAKFKSMRIIPPYYLTTKRVLCLYPGSIVKRLPKIEFYIPKAR